MVARVSTVGSYSAVLANLLNAQARLSDAGDKVATKKNGSDLKSYSKNAEMLTAMRSVQTRMGVYTEQNKMIADKLTTQDTALTSMVDAAAASRQAIADALAAGRADTLMEELGAQMRNAVEGMNARYGGKYLFAGGQVDTKPVTASRMADLTSGPPLASFFKNDSFQTQAKVDDSTTITTGMLANDVGQPMLAGLQAIQVFQEGPDGPFNGVLTDNQRIFLENQLAGWDTIRSDLTIKTARNGLLQQRVDTVKKDLTTRSITLDSMVGEITDADMARAATDLEAAQMSVQATAQVFLTLQNTSLLNILK
ncbi:MAG: flagellin [Phenylobacterium sp.]